MDDVLFLLLHHFANSINNYFSQLKVKEYTSFQGVVKTAVQSFCPSARNTLHH